MNLLNISKYLNETESLNKIQSLNEAQVMSQRKQFWPKFTIGDMVRLMKYLPDWNSQSDQSTLTVKDVPDTQITGLENFNKTIAKNACELSYQGKVDPNTNGGSYIKKEMPTLVLNYQGESTDVIDTFVKSTCTPQFMPEGAKLLEPDIRYKTITNKKDKTTKQLTICTYKIEFLDSQSAQKFHDFVKQSLATSNSGIFVKLNAPSGKRDVTIKGKLNKVFAQYLSIILPSATLLASYTQDFDSSTFDIDKSIEKIQNAQPKLKPQIDQFVSDVEFVKPMTDLQKWLFKMAYECIFSQHSVPDHFDNKSDELAAKLAGKDYPTIIALSKEEKWPAETLVEVLNAMKNPHFSSCDEFCKFFKESHVVQQIKLFNRQLKKQSTALAQAKEKYLETVGDPETPEEKKAIVDKLNQITAEEKNKWSITKQLPQVSTLIELQKLIDWQGTVADIEKKADKSDFKQAAPSHATSCSSRRMKLFDAAVKRDPKTKIVTSEKWVAAICFTKQATAPFGRLKPKVKKGTNDIIPECNLESWEGITPENRLLRDSWQTKQVDTIRDNIDDGYGHSFNRLTGEHSQNGANNGHDLCETAWCFTGVLSLHYGWDEINGSSDFNNYTEHGKRPIVVFMDTSRGALYAYAHFNKNGMTYENFLNENEKCDGDSPTGSDPSDARQMKFLNDFKTANPEFVKILKYINKKYFSDLSQDFNDEIVTLNDSDMFKQNAGESENAYIDKYVAQGFQYGAARRMKLFKCAEHFGAKIMMFDNWVVAACNMSNKKQLHSFCRYKPPVKVGTNTIVPGCNLEDWEGITPENKMIRDRKLPPNKQKLYDVIDDGIVDESGHKSYHHEGKSGQTENFKWAEAGWCIGGGLGHFEWSDYNWSYGYSNLSLQNNVFVFMKKSTGMIYLYAKRVNSEEFANERDMHDDTLNQGNNGSAQVKWMNDVLIAKNPEFGSILKKIKAVYGGGAVESSAGEGPMTKEQLIQYAEQKGYIDQNGALILTSYSNLQKFASILNEFSQIRVVYNDYHYFENRDISNVDEIDFCGNKILLSGAFKNAKIGILKLTGTQNVTAFDHAFEEATVSQITEIDTRSTKTIARMFYKTHSQKSETLKLPQLDLRSCTSMIEAFSFSRIQTVKLINTDNITNATDAYINCQHLEVVPPIKFKQIASIKQLSKSGSVDDIFAGCTTLYNSDFQTGAESIDISGILADVENYYSSKNPTYFDKDGFFCIDAQNPATVDAYSQLKLKIKKIKVVSKNSAQLFYGQKFYATEIDLTAVEDANSMFFGVQFNHGTPKFTGCQNIKLANFMFAGSDLQFMPSLDMSSVTKINNIFSSCPILKLSKTFKFSRNVLSDINTSCIFGEGDENIAKNSAGEGRLNTWCGVLKKRALAGLSEKAMHDGWLHVAFFGKGSCISPDDKYISPKMALELIAENGLTDNEDFHGIKLYNIDSSSNNKFNNISMPDFIMPIIDFSEFNHKDISHIFEKSTFKGFKGFTNCSGIAFANQAFKNFKSEDEIPDLSFETITNGYEMFMNCSCSKIPAEKFKNLRVADSMFDSAEFSNYVLNVDDIALDKIQKCPNMFKNTNVQMKQLVLPESCQDSTDMFINTKFDNSETVEKIKITNPNGKNSGMFSLSTGIKNIKYLVIKSLTAHAMFANVSDLEHITYLDIEDVQDIGNMFLYCKSLTAICWFKIEKKTTLQTVFTHSCPVAVLFGKSFELYFKSNAKCVVPKYILNKV